MTIATARDFHADMQWSLAGSDEPFWHAVYWKAFPNLKTIEVCADLPRQKQGIDRLLHLTNGKTLAVDEKKRGREYADILLEYTSCEERNTPGWIERDLAIDYLAYGFMQSQRCYLFPWAMLRRAWAQFGQDWKAKYRPVRAATTVGSTQYHTLSVAVPIDVLRRAVSTAAVIDVSGLQGA